MSQGRKVVVIVSGSLPSGIRRKIMSFGCHIIESYNLRDYIMDAPQNNGESNPWAVKRKGKGKVTRDWEINKKGR